MTAPAAICVLVMLAAPGCGSSGDSKNVKLFRVPSPSMEPSYDVGDRVVVDLDAYKSSKPAAGDVVILHPPRGADQELCGIVKQPRDGHPCARPSGGEDTSLEFIKRVAAVGGDSVKIAKNRTYIGGKQQDEPYIKAGGFCGPLCNLPKTVTVPQGSYFVLGDNRGESSDSRIWGPVPLDWIVGKVTTKD